MKKLVEKIRLPLCVILSAAVITGIAALIPAVLQGRENTIYTVTETLSEIENDEISVADLLQDADVIPSYFHALKAESIKTATCRKYNESVISAQGCTVSIRNYKYAYLTEDESISVPEDAVSLVWNNNEVLIFDSGNGMTAVYFCDLTRCIITCGMTSEEFAKIFN